MSGHLIHQMDRRIMARSRSHVRGTTTRWAMDSNILIRTMTAGKGFWQFPVGGGIVADSDPETEYAETLHKAAGMLRALRK